VLAVPLPVPLSLLVLLLNATLVLLKQLGHGPSVR
jgi:hypothetical protein